MEKKPARTSAVEEKKRSIESTVLIALISGVVTVIVALLGFPPLIAYLTPAPTLTPSTTPVFTEISSPIPTDFNSPTAMPTPTPTLLQATTATPLVSSVTDTPTSRLSIMYVRLVANKTTGKAPLLAKFNAMDSYVRAPDGTIFECGKGACRFTWTVSLGVTQIAKANESKNGTFEYRFASKGRYLVTVHICHGADHPTCDLGSVFVEVD